MFDGSGQDEHKSSSQLHLHNQWYDREYDGKLLNGLVCMLYVPRAGVMRLHIVEAING